MVASSLAVLRFILVVRSSPLLANALPPVFLGPSFWAVRFLPSLLRGCRRRASSVWTPLALSCCGRRRVVGWRCRFAFVVQSSRLRATQVSPVVVGASLHAGQVLFPSGWWCVLRHHRFVAVFVWESLEWQCCVTWNIRFAWSLGWRSCRSGHSSAPFLF